MSERPETAASTPARRGLKHGLGFVGVLIALLIAVPAVLFRVLPSCGCTPPADLIVLNYSHQDARVSWQAVGLLGLPVIGVSGSATALGCAPLSETMHPGSVDVSIHTGSDTQTARWTVAASPETRSSHTATFVIGADGRIAGPLDGSPAGGYPQDPLCP